jgi:hypothetical protein
VRDKFRRQTREDRRQILVVSNTGSDYDTACPDRFPVLQIEMKPFTITREPCYEGILQVRYKLLLKGFTVGTEGA